MCQRETASDVASGKAKANVAARKTLASAKCHFGYPAAAAAAAAAFAAC